MDKSSYSNSNSNFNASSDSKDTPNLKRTLHTSAYLNNSNSLNKHSITTPPLPSDQVNNSKYNNSLMSEFIEHALLETCCRFFKKEDPLFI